MTDRSSLDGLPATGCENTHFLWKSAIGVFFKSTADLPIIRTIKPKLEGMETTLGLIEATFPAATQLIDPCGYCRREEGVFCVPWPDIPSNEWFLVCGRCLWRKFHEVPKGPNRRAMLHKVFAQRLFGRDLKKSSSP